MASTSPIMLTPELTPSHSIASSPSILPTPDARALDIVIAHYNENLEWLAPFSDLVSLYSKGQPPSSPFVPREAKNLPNWGRESHTYLHHIVHNYESLADVTLFLQGNIHDINDGTPAHTALTLAQIVEMAKRMADLPSGANLEEQLYQDRPVGGILPLGKMHRFSDWDGIKYLPGWVERRGKTLNRSQYTPARFWNYLINGSADPEDERWVTPPAQIQWTQGALFAITRQTIHRRPKEVYQRAYEYFHNKEDVNPEEGHYMERFWLSIFSTPDLPPATVQDPVKSEDLATHTHAEYVDGVFTLEDVH
jgi:hypothetical protein